MGAMRVEGADPALPVAEHDDLLAEELHLFRQIGKLVREADRLPVAAQEFAHRAAPFDAGQLVIGRRGLATIGRFHRTPPLPSARGGVERRCKRRAAIAVNSELFNAPWPGLSRSPTS